MYRQLFIKWRSMVCILVGQRSTLGRQWVECRSTNDRYLDQSRYRSRYPKRYMIPTLSCLQLTKTSPNFSLKFWIQNYFADSRNMPSFELSLLSYRYTPRSYWCVFFLLYDNRQNRELNHRGSVHFFIFLPIIEEACLFKNSVSGFKEAVRCGIPEMFKTLICISLPNKSLYCLITCSTEYSSQFSAIPHLTPKRRLIVLKISFWNPIVGANDDGSRF